MKRPTFLQGVGVALLASFSGGVLFSVLSGPLPYDLVLRGVIAMLGLVYTLYLLIHSDERVSHFETEYFDMVALALRASPSELVGLVSS